MADPIADMLKEPPPEEAGKPCPPAGGGIVMASADWFINWARRSSLWSMTFGIACCAIEMMAAAASRYDWDRYGIIPRGSPRQSDLMVVAGTVTAKMAPVVRRLFDQMADPKYVIAMGACTIGGGPYAKHAYHVVKGVDKVIPVDVYVPGCPPRPEALLEGILKLQAKIKATRGTLKGTLLNP